MNRKAQAGTWTKAGSEALKGHWMRWPAGRRPATRRDATHRWLRAAGCLDGLLRSCNRTEWIGYHDLRGEIERAELDAQAMKPPPRTVWRGFADAGSGTDADRAANG